MKWPGKFSETFLLEKNYYLNYYSAEQSTETMGSDKNNQAHFDYV